MPIDFTDFLRSLRSDGKLFVSTVIKAAAGKKILTDARDTVTATEIDLEDEAGVPSTIRIPKGGAGAGTDILTAVVDVTNAQIKNLDTDYIELIPAVASNEYIKVDQMWFHKFGSDAPTITSSNPTPNAESLDHYTNYIVSMMVTNTAAALPLGEDHGDYIWVVGGDLQDGGHLLRPEPYVDGAGVGGHAFAEGTPLVMGLVASPRRYSAAAWDEFIASVNDVSMRISIFYSVHSRPSV